VDLSVVIPTHDRCNTLLRTLKALDTQQGETGTYEVLVVDDGSTDSTAEKMGLLRGSYSVPLSYFYQPKRGQGSARNLGARAARGKLVVFLGDDIVPTPFFLQQHQRAHHAKMNASNPYGVIGYTTWPDELPRTRFLDYIGEQGWQFGYSLITDPEDVPFNFLYTSNVSLPRFFFLSCGGFDEDFQQYGWEDIELSLRLFERGMRLSYEPSAVAHHHHPTTIASFVQRQTKVGFSAWRFFRKHPELAEFLSVNRIPRYSFSDHIRMRLLTILCRLTETARYPDLSRFYPDLMSYYYIRGLIAGRAADATSEQHPGEASSPTPQLE
jgi:glycosyltransferase involved in cell wall biosynthesis